MQTQSFSRRSHCLIWTAALLVSLAIFLATPARPAQAACGGTTDVANQIELSSAINAFNAVSTGPCTFTIRLTDNIPLTVSIPFIFNSSAGVELVIQGQNFAVDGQGIFNVRPFNISNATVTMENLTITGGNITIQGSGINNNGGTLTLQQSTVRNNQGGLAALNNFGGIVTLIDSEISDNATAGLQSSGSGAEATLQQSVVRGNSSASAGGINNFGIITLIESTVEDNTGGSGGGLVNIGSSAEMTLQRSTVSGNTTSAFAGGITNSSGTLILTNSTISGNSGDVGAIQTTGPLTLNNSTITNNSAGNPLIRPGGVWIQLGGSFTLANSLIADQETGDDCMVQGAITSAVTSNGYNLDSDGTCLDPAVAVAGDIPSGTADLAALADNGGPTATHLPQAGSDAIDAIPTTLAGTRAPQGSDALNAGCVGTGLVIDQRGASRPQGSGCDIGSVEAGAPLAVTVGWFLAEADGASVVFRWQTVTENGTAGFRILAVDEQGKHPLNQELIPSPVIDSLTPTNYEYAAVTEAERFYLQEVEINGGVTEHGPYQLGRQYGSYTTPPQNQMTSTVWLPLVAR